MHTDDLFPDDLEQPPEQLAPQAWLVRGCALPQASDLLAAVAEVQAQSPFRHMVTPGGHTMSVALTNCGALGWTSDEQGYRYSATDPLQGRPWPALPKALRQLAREAAAQAGFARFEPDACLVNRYLTGARMSLHQDRNERDFSAPIVSVSLGMPATFLFGGQRRSDPVRRLMLMHGDVVVWGGEDRLRFHGVAPLRDHPHPLLGSQRINLTFRKAG